MPSIIRILTAAVLLAFSVSTAYAANVEVSYSSKLTRSMDRLNAMEIRYEEFFRKYRDSYRADAVSSNKLFNVSRLGNVAWAGETLIPNLADFNVTNLTKALVIESLERAGLGNLEGTIRIKVERLKVTRHSLSFLRSTDSYVIGTFEHIDANGNVLKSIKFSANLVYDVSVDLQYTGPGFAFFTGDAALRVGPALARFIEKGLENLFDDREFTKVTLIGP